MTRRWSITRIAASILLFMAGVVSFGLMGVAVVPGYRALWLVLELGCFALALRPFYGVALILTGLSLLGVGQLDGPNVWNLLFVVCFAAGAWLSLRRLRTWRWIVASFPFWAMADAVPSFMMVALGMTLMGIAAPVMRMLPTRRISNGPPALPQLAHGPLVRIEPRLFAFRRADTLLRIAQGIVALGVAGGVVLWFSGLPQPAIVVGVLALLIGGSIWGSLAFSYDMKYWVDETGLHSRVAFHQQTIRWSDVGQITLRYFSMPMQGYSAVVYCIRSTNREITFPNTLVGSPELRDVIARATGLEWPQPRIQPTAR